MDHCYQMAETCLHAAGFTITDSHSPVVKLLVAELDRELPEDERWSLSKSKQALFWQYRCSSCLCYNSFVLVGNA